MHFTDVLFTIALPFVGGLGLFLLGMKLMSDSLEKTAGARLRKLLEALTNNRLLGVVVGMVFTMIIQSSSATTVMVVGLVNAGLMNLTQATGVIMGANIGTTVTGQLVALNLSDWAPAFLFAGVLLLLFVRKKKVSNIGAALVGFGILFMGLSMMSTAMKPLREIEAFINILARFRNPVLGILAGAALTCVIQSSSASLGILQAMALEGLVTLDSSVYIILGFNIGTCITALLASIGTLKTARRAALIHLFFNLLGTLIMLLPLNVLPVARWIGALTPDNPMKQIANFHTFFNILAVAVLLPLSRYLVTAVEKVLPGSDPGAEPMRLMFIDEKVFATPPIAVAHVIREVDRMADLSVTNIRDAIDAFLNKDEELIRTVLSREKVVDYLNHEITRTLVHINQLEITPEDKQIVGSLFHVVNDLERISDHAENIAEYASARIEGIPFSETALSELREMSAKVLYMLELGISVYRDRDKRRAKALEPLEQEINNMEKHLRNTHIGRLNNGQCSASSGMIFIETISNLERVADHSTNIAYSILSD